MRGVDTLSCFSWENSSFWSKDLYMKTESTKERKKAQKKSNKRGIAALGRRGYSTIAVVLYVLLRLAVLSSSIVGVRFEVESGQRHHKACIRE